jgi:hypothetical protein
MACMAFEPGTRASHSVPGLIRIKSTSHGSYLCFRSRRTDSWGSPNADALTQSMPLLRRKLHAHLRCGTTSPNAPTPQLSLVIDSRCREPSLVQSTALQMTGHLCQTHMETPVSCRFSDLSHAPSKQGLPVLFRLALLLHLRHRKYTDRSGKKSRVFACNRNARGNRDLVPYE